MTALHRLCRSSDVGDNTMRLFRVEKVDVLAGRINGRLFACDNSCPHRGASLALGHLSGDRVVCYMHGYEYNAFTGSLENMKSWKKEDTWLEQSPAWRQSGDLVIYKISERDGDVYVEL